MTGAAPRDRWQIDKRIPVATIIVLLMQTAGAVWWAASLSARVDSLEASNASIKEAALKRDESFHALSTRAAIMEEKVVGLQKQGERIESKLDTALDRKR